MKIKKYGGSSLANIDKIKAVANDIKNDKEKQIVIVSAKEGYTNKILSDAYEMSSNPSKREIDQMIITGEMINASLLAIYLNEINVSAKSLNAFNIPIISSNDYTDGKIKWINKKYLDSQLEEVDVLVITGFQGISYNDFVSLGRGGSDTTALAIAKIYNQECYIYTDVSGVFVVDPKIMETKRIENISYDNMVELSYDGGKVLASKASEIAKKYKVPTKILKTHTNNYTLIGDIEDYGPKAVSSIICACNEDINNSFFVIENNNIEAFHDDKDGTLAFIAVVGSFLLKSNCHKKIINILKNTRIFHKHLIMKENYITFIVLKKDKDIIIKEIVDKLNL